MLDYDLIFSLINKQGVKLITLSKFIGMSPEGFKKTLQNKKLTVANLEKIAEFFEMHPGQFFPNTDLLNNTEIEILKLKLESKTKELKDKEEIISLLKRQIR